jgi:hypothetical protein
MDKYYSKDVITGSIVSHQTYGDMMRFNPHWHCIIMEGGIDDKNDFYHIKIKDSVSLTETFRRRVIKLFVDKELLNKDFAKQLLTWKNSGFSIDNSIFLFPYDDKAREGLCQYIPPKHKHLILYYGLYASRTKGKARQDGRYERFGIKKETSPEQDNHYNTDYEEPTNKAGKQAWARLIQKVYEVDPLICLKCGSEMRIVAIIMDKNEIDKIVKHLDKKRSPPEAKMVS